VKKSLIALIVLAACAPKVTSTTSTAPVGAPAPAPATAPTVSSSEPGGATARAAVQSFLDAVKGQDIQGMSAIFGTSAGPSRNNMSRDELEKRLIILQCYFNHDKSSFVSESPGVGGHRVVQFQLTRGSITRSPSFYAIPGPGGRWFVDNMEIAAVRDLQAKPC